jgi:hypothetical protein
MRITYDINTLAEAEQARDTLQAIVEAFRPVERPSTLEVAESAPAAEPAVELTQADTPPAPKVRRARRSKANGTAEPQVEPEPEQVNDIAEPQAEPEFNDADACEKLRLLAVERGVQWLRPILVQYAVQKLSDLTPSQVRELLNAA